MNKTKNDILSKYGGSMASWRTNTTAAGAVLLTGSRRISGGGRQFDLFLHRSLYPQITITRKMILDYYQTNIAKFTQDPKVDLYTITIPFAKHLPPNPTPEQICHPARTLTLESMPSR